MCAGQRHTYIYVTLPHFIKYYTRKNLKDFLEFRGDKDIRSSESTLDLGVGARSEEVKLG